MLPLAMPGEVLLSSNFQGGNFQPGAEMDDSNRKLKEMAEKLEKSEAGRKKLRQAIAMLKEKMEATEKVLQVNETLRQEYEKERSRAEMERKNAEEEKSLRLQIENENLSMKEQLVGVLQRLDAVERNSKSDREETLRVRGEMKQALSALSGALRVAEASHSSVQGLEKFVQDKLRIEIEASVFDVTSGLLQPLTSRVNNSQVNNSVSTSTRALSLAQSMTSDVRAAQGAAASAERTSQSLLSRLAIVQKQSAGLDQRINLLQQETSKAFSLAQNVSADAKAAQVTAASAGKMSQSLVARVAAVQKQSAGFDHRVNLLQQELRTRFVDVGVTLNGARTANGGVPCADKRVYNKGMVLSKSQQPNGASVNVVKSPHRSSVVGSSDLSHDTVQRESFVRLNVLCVQPESQGLESTQLVDSGSSSGCQSTVSRELDLSLKDKVNISTRERRSLHSRSVKCTSSQEDTQSASKLGTGALGKMNLDSSRVSLPVSGEPDESRFSNTDVSIPQICAVTRRKFLSTKGVTTRPFNSEFSGRQRVCGAGSTHEDKAQDLPLRETQAEEGLEALDTGDDKVAKRQRKVKLPAALLKDITKLFSKEKKVQVRMEAKFMSLEQSLRNGWENGTFEEQIPGQETRKRKRREKKRKSERVLNGDSDQKVEKKSRLGIAPQAVGDCYDSLGRKASRNRSKDGLTGDPSTQVQSTPPFALPKVSESVVAGTSMTAKLPEQSSKGIAGADSRAESSVSCPDGERCTGPEQLREGMKLDEENASEGVQSCRDFEVDKGGTTERTVTSSSGLSERAGITGDGKEHLMDIDEPSGKAVHHSAEGTGHGWDTESDFSDDEFDPEWWTTERVLLSPTLPELQPQPCTPAQAAPSNTDLVPSQT